MSREPPGLPELATLVRPSRSWMSKERKRVPTEDTNTCGCGEYGPCSEGNSLRFISASFLKTTTRRENSVLSRRTGTGGKRKDVPSVGRTVLTQLAKEGENRLTVPNKMSTHSAARVSWATSTQPSSHTSCHVPRCRDKYHAVSLEIRTKGTAAWKTKRKTAKLQVSCLGISPSLKNLQEFL